MKVKIKDLKPNPYRDIVNYPFDKDKIQSLKDSINQTGFWDNILARKQNGQIQIAYGHHRLEALKSVMKPDDLVDIPVKELSDALMIKIMANENMDEWRPSPRIIDETVRVTKQFLEEHPEEVKKMEFRSSVEKGIGAIIIKTFLSWPESRVSYSLERLRLIKDDIIDEEAINQLPTEYSSRSFIKAVRETNLPLHKQKAAVEKILDTKRGESVIMDAVIGEKYTTPKKKQEYKSEKIIKYESYIAGIRNKVDELFEDLKDLIKTEKELGEIGDNIYKRLLLMSLNTLSKQIELIINNQNNEKIKSTNSNLRSITD